MKEDLLEKFIRDHRDEWDDKKAPDGIWNKVLKDLPSEEQQTSSIWKSIAIILGIVLIVIISYLSVQKEGQSLDRTTDSNLEYAELPDFKETENFYMSAIFASQQKVNEQHIDATLENDLRLLDQNTQELRQEYQIAQGAYKENILRAIILNHQVKLQILERVLQNIQTNEISTNEKLY